MAVDHMGWTIDGEFDLMCHEGALTCARRPSERLACYSRGRLLDREGYVSAHSILDLECVDFLACVVEDDGLGGEELPIGGPLKCTDAATFGWQVWMTGRFRRVSCGGRGCCAVRDDGTLRCTDDRLQPPEGRCVDVQTSRDTACALDGDGQVHCWGGLRLRAALMSSREPGG